MKGEASQGEGGRTGMKEGREGGKEAKEGGREGRYQVGVS